MKALLPYCFGKNLTGTGEMASSGEKCLYGTGLYEKWWKNPLRTTFSQLARVPKVASDPSDL
jgi:hypothetical protein